MLPPIHGVTVSASPVKRFDLRILYGGMTELPYCDLEIQRCAPAHRIGIIWAVGGRCRLSRWFERRCSKQFKRGTTMPYEYA